MYCNYLQLHWLFLWIFQNNLQTFIHPFSNDLSRLISWGISSENFTFSFFLETKVCMLLLAWLSPKLSFLEFHELFRPGMTKRKPGFSRESGSVREKSQCSCSLMQAWTAWKCSISSQFTTKSYEIPIQRFLHTITASCNLDTFFAHSFPQRSSSRARNLG